MSLLSLTCREWRKRGGEIGNCQENLSRRMKIGEESTRDIGTTRRARTRALQSRSLGRTEPKDGERAESVYSDNHMFYNVDTTVRVTLVDVLRIWNEVADMVEANNKEKNKR